MLGLVAFGLWPLGVSYGLLNATWHFQQTLQSREDTFLDTLVQNKMPRLIKNTSAGRWPALTKWTNFSYLSSLLLDNQSPGVLREVLELSHGKSR